MLDLEFYTMRLTNAVRRLDINKFKKFAEQFCPDLLNRDERVIELTMYKVAANLTTLPEATRQQAIKWLKDHNSSPDILGRPKAKTTSIYGEMEGDNNGKIN